MDLRSRGSMTAVWVGEALPHSVMIIQTHPRNKIGQSAVKSPASLIHLDSNRWKICFVVGMSPRPDREAKLDANFLNYPDR